jgi:4-amino-4-deoxy-L-arabinose transferase-like glycosyltransferase
VRYHRSVTSGVSIADADGASLTGGPSHVRAQAVNRWLAPVALVLLAFAVRLVVISVDGGYEPANDAFEYDYNARSIAAGEGYPRSGYLLQGGPSAIRGPGYPYLLGSVYALSGDSRTAGRVAGALLGALIVFLLYLIVKRIWGRRTALLGAALAAIFPPLVLLSRDLVSESLFIALVLGATLSVLELRRSGGALRWAALAGILCGLAALTRNTGFALLLPVALGVWTARPRLRPASLLAPALVVTCAALATTPWLMRNAAEFGRLAPLTTSAGVASAGTYNEASYRDGDSHGAWRNPQGVPQFAPLFHANPAVDEVDLDRELRREAAEFAWRHPGYVAETSAWNLLRLFEIVDGSVVDSQGRVVADRGIGSAVLSSERAGIAIVVALALLGFSVILRARAESRYRGGPPRIPSGPLFLWLIPILMILVAMPVAGLPRYRLPADPFLLILAAVGLAWLLDRLAASPSEAR